MKGLSNHEIFFSRDIGSARFAEIENTLYIAAGFRTSKIACYKTTEIFCEGNAQVTRAPARTSLHFGVHCDLGSGGHDGAITSSSHET